VIQINIRTTTGTYPVYAWVYGQWAAHHRHDGHGWRVTHVPSGLTTSEIADSLEEPTAMLVAEELSQRLPVLRFADRVSADDAAMLRTVFAELVK
jgi:hypothetical protein